MSMRWNQPATWIGAAVVALCLGLAAAAGLWEYMSRTATVLHPDPDSVPFATGTAPAPPWRDAADAATRLTREALATQNLAGISVAVGAGQRLVWSSGAGWADLERRIAVTPDTRFRLGTASTVLTSAAVGTLLERGRLRLDDDIRTHVPAWPVTRGPATLRQVMGHVAGLVSDGGDEGPLLSQHCERPGEALPAFADRQLRFTPGTDHRVSSYGWILVSAAVEAASGEPFLRAMRKQVFEPLGMHDTVADAPAPDRAVSYFPRFSADPSYGLDPMREVDYSCYAGASMFVSTPSDLVRFGLGMGGGALLAAATVEELQTSLRLPSGDDTGYGLGWDLERVSLGGVATPSVGHRGEVLGGEVATLLTFPAHGLVVAVIANTSYADTFTLATRIADAFATAASGATGRG